MTPGSITLHAAFTGSNQQIAQLGQAVEGFCRPRDVPPAAIWKVLLALEELLTNVDKYGRRSEAPIEVDVTVSVAADGVIVVYEDDGAAFDPLAQAPPPDLQAAPEERSVGGLGIHLLRGLFDEVSYAWVGDRNQVVLRLLHVRPPAGA